MPKPDIIIATRRAGIWFYVMGSVENCKNKTATFTSVAEKAKRFHNKGEAHQYATKVSNMVTYTLETYQPATVANQKLQNV